MVSRRDFIKTLATSSLALSMQGGCGNSEDDAARPNIVFFLVDDQRNDTLGCAGHPVLKTPNIDAIADKGVHFQNAFVTTSICAASRASIVTGLYERSHGFTFGKPAINDEYISTSYPVALRLNGYRVGYIGKSGILVSRQSLDSMFDDFRPLGRVPYFQTMPDGSKRHETDLAADYAIDYLQQNKSGPPFCLGVSFNAVHADHTNLDNQYPWPPFADGMYENDDIPEPELSDPTIFAALPDFLKRSLNRERYFWRWNTPEKYQKNMRAYFRMISGVDNAIGRVLAELEILGLEQNTIVVYMADNGYYMGNRGFAGKWSHYEESLRIPLIIKDPRVQSVTAGTKSELTALNVDIAPTLLELAGVAVPDRYQGHSLANILRGEYSTDWREDFFCEHLMDHAGIPKWEGVRHNRFVYARYFEQKPVFEFLHDLDNDPRQLVNFASDAKYRDVLIAARQRCDDLAGRYTNI